LQAAAPRGGATKNVKLKKKNNVAPERSLKDRRGTSGRGKRDQGRSRRGRGESTLPLHSPESDHPGAQTSKINLRPYHPGGESARLEGLPGGSTYQGGNT